MKTKFCIGCKKDLPINQFRLVERGDRGYITLRPRCKSCDKEKARAYSKSKRTPEALAKSRIWAKEYRKNHPEKQKESNLKKIAKQLMIIPTDLIAMVNSHSKSCDICGRSESEVGTLHVDHNHQTNDVRGLLCSNCNAGIGQFQDDIQLLTKAMGYLQQPPKLISTQHPIEIDQAGSRQSELRSLVETNGIFVSKRSKSLMQFHKEKALNSEA